MLQLRIFIFDTNLVKEYIKEKIHENYSAISYTEKAVTKFLSEEW